MIKKNLSYQTLKSKRPISKLLKKKLKSLKRINKRLQKNLQNYLAKLKWLLINKFLPKRVNRKNLNQKFLSPYPASQNKLKKSSPRLKVKPNQNLKIWSITCYKWMMTKRARRWVSLRRLNNNLKINNNNKFKSQNLPLKLKNHRNKPKRLFLIQKFNPKIKIRFRKRSKNKIVKK